MFLGRGANPEILYHRYMLHKNLVSEKDNFPKFPGRNHLLVVLESNFKD